MNKVDWSYYNLLEECLDKMKDLRSAYARHVENSKKILIQKDSSSSEDETDKNRERGTRTTEKIEKRIF
ncbi:MAG: hypothetical protein ACKO96_05300 [Flammeovirgaceae bacterium]